MTTPQVMEAMSHRRRPPVRQAFSWLITVVLMVALFLLIRWSGLALNTVSTDSMVPTYAPTDMVITLSPERIAPAEGEAIVFETDYVGQHIPPHIHRLVGRNDDGSWITQGDANESPDGWRVTPENIHGVAVYSIPGSWLRDPRLLGGLLFVVLAIGLWPRNEDGDPESVEE